MRKRIISESFENRMYELSGIIQENAHKIMKLGFDNSIADYLAGIDKKRGMFLADSLTKQYIKDNGMSELQGLSTRDAISSINQKELFDYMKSRENDSLSVLSFIKQSAGKVDLKSFESFNDIVFAIKDRERKINELINSGTIALDDNRIAEAKGYFEEVLILDSENQIAIEKLVLIKARMEKEEGFNPDINNYLRGLDFDIGVELGIISLKGFFKHEYPEADLNSVSLSEMINSINQKEFLVFLKENEDELRVIITWVLVISDENKISGTEKLDFIKDKNFQNLGDVFFEANSWHLTLPASGKLKTPWAGRKVEEYSDGYYWVDLDTNDSYDEGQAMGHCGFDPSATTLLSLRDPEGGPHITIAYNERTKNIAQVKGKQNKKPLDKYTGYADKLLEKMIKQDKVRSFVWSYPAYGKDMSDEDVEKLLDDNLSAKAKFKIAKKGAVRRRGGGNLGVRYRR